MYEKATAAPDTPQRRTPRSCTAARMPPSVADNSTSSAAAVVSVDVSAASSLPPQAAKTIVDTATIPRTRFRTREPLNFMSAFPHLCCVGTVRAPTQRQGPPHGPQRCSNGNTTRLCPTPNRLVGNKVVTQRGGQPTAYCTARLARNSASAINSRTAADGSLNRSRVMPWIWPVNR